MKGKLNFEEELTPTSGNLQDVEEALIALGYHKKEIAKVLGKLDATLEVGSLIKQALQMMMK